MRPTSSSSGGGARHRAASIPIWFALIPKSRRASPPASSARHGVKHQQKGSRGHAVQQPAKSPQKARRTRPAAKAIVAAPKSPGGAKKPERSSSAAPNKSAAPSKSAATADAPKRATRGNQLSTKPSATASSPSLPNVWARKSLRKGGAAVKRGKKTVARTPAKRGRGTVTILSPKSNPQPTRKATRPAAATSSSSRASSSTPSNRVAASASGSNETMSKLKKYGNSLVGGAALGDLDALFGELTSHLIEMSQEHGKEMAQMKALHAAELQRAGTTIRHLEDKTKQLEAKLADRFRKDHLSIVSRAAQSSRI